MIAMLGGLGTRTERHMDITLFGEILMPLQPWIYREILSRASKRARLNNPDKRGGYLCDYLRILPGQSDSAAGVELGIWSVLGPRLIRHHGPIKQRKPSVLLLARWQLTEIIRSSYPFVERSTLRKLINIAVVTDCRTLYFYHVHPFLDAQDWVLVKHDA